MSSARKLSRSLTSVGQRSSPIIVTRNNGCPSFSPHFELIGCPMNLVQRAQRKAFTSLNVFSCEAFIITERIRTKTEGKGHVIVHFFFGLCVAAAVRTGSFYFYPPRFSRFPKWQWGSIFTSISSGATSKPGVYMSQKDNVLIIDGVMRQKDILWTIRWKRTFSWFLGEASFLCYDASVETFRQLSVIRYHFRNAGVYESEYLRSGTPLIGGLKNWCGTFQEETFQVTL